MHTAVGEYDMYNVLEGACMVLNVLGVCVCVCVCVCCVLCVV